LEGGDEGAGAVVFAAGEDRGGDEGASGGRPGGDGAFGCGY
jgi:hypothetical protein